jgi:DNA topoisomerase-1
MPREKVLATVVSLLDKTLIRIGNDGYVRDNGSYGLTTLRNRHLEVAGSEMRFQFKGKSGKMWRLSVRDRRIARIVRSIQELPGQSLFQYLDDEGATRSIDSADVNDYLREIAGADVSAKDFRTWAGTVLAVLALSALEAFTTQTQAKMNVRRAIAAVADKLGNTPTICRKCYIHPEIVACYMEGALSAVAAAPATHAASSALPREEAAVLRLLKRRLAPQRRPRRKPSQGVPLQPAA